MNKLALAKLLRAKLADYSVSRAMSESRAFASMWHFLKRKRGALHSKTQLELERKRAEQRVSVARSGRQPDGRVLVAFSAGGILWAYYLGVVAFLRDSGMVSSGKLDSRKVRLSGVSGGASAAVALYCGVPMKHCFEFVQMWQTLFESRPFLNCWLLTSDRIATDIRHKLKADCGIDDDYIQRLSELRGGDALLFGATKLQPTVCSMRALLSAPTDTLSFESLSHFQSVDDVVTAALCSMCTLPFFRTATHFRGMRFLDGSLAADFAVPFQCDHCKVVRVSVSREDVSEIRPVSHRFELSDFCHSGTFADNLQRFEVGYRSAAHRGAVHNCVAKGLRMDEASTLLFSEPSQWHRFVRDRVEHWHCHLTDARASD